MTEAMFEEMLARRKESGLTIRDFCSNEGISESIYYYWQKKHNNKADQPKEFIPLLMGNHLPAQRKNLLSRVNPASPEINQQENIPLEFVFPNGTRLMVRNPADFSILQAIVHLYD